jgi:hypothetical protein
MADEDLPQYDSDSDKVRADPTGARPAVQAAAAPPRTCRAAPRWRGKGAAASGFCEATWQGFWRDVYGHVRVRADGGRAGVAGGRRRCRQASRDCTNPPSQRVARILLLLFLDCDLTVTFSSFNWRRGYGWQIGLWRERRRWWWRRGAERSHSCTRFHHIHLFHFHHCDHRNLRYANCCHPLERPDSSLLQHRGREFERRDYPL